MNDSYIFFIKFELTHVNKTKHFFTPISPCTLSEDTLIEWIKKMAITLSKELWSYPYATSYGYSRTVICKKTSSPSKETYHLFAVAVLSLITWKKPRLEVWKIRYQYFHTYGGL